METYQININEEIANNILYDFFDDKSIKSYICNKKVFNEKCSICLEKLDFNEKRQFRCGHYFHKDCIDKWFKSSMSLKCPYCKQLI